MPTKPTRAPAPEHAQRGAPTSLNMLDDPEYRAAYEAVVRWETRTQDLERELSDTYLQGAQREELDAAARRVLAGGPALPREERPRRPAQAIEDELRVSRRAAELAQESFQRARTLASRRICAGLVERHKALGQALVDATLGLLEAAEAEARLRDELDRAGVSFSPPLVPVAIGALGPDCHVLRYWLRELGQTGYVTVPKMG